VDKKHILVVDDEKALRSLIRDYLIKANYSVSEAANGEDAVEVFFNQKIDLIILDIMMPGMNGYEVLTEIRKHTDVPVIMLTAKDDEESEILGFNLKADDYVTKPFSAKALMARIEAVFRRYLKEGEHERIGVLEYNKSKYDIILDNKPLNLTKREFELFTYLFINQGIVLTREKILNNVWGFNYEGDIRTVDVYIKELRKKLTNKADYIKTIRGVGYEFEAQE